MPAHPSLFLRHWLLREGGQGAAVVHEVDSGGVAHGAEALDEADDEKDQGFVGRGDVNG